MLMDLGPAMEQPANAHRIKDNTVRLRNRLKLKKYDRIFILHSSLDDQQHDPSNDVETDLRFRR